MSFLAEISSFKKGGFRYAVKATSNHHKFRDATYVIKRYKTLALENTEILKQSPEIHSRKVDQINSLARNLAARFSDTVTKDFSKIVYNKVFFEKVDENEFATVEFQKYISNDGTIVNGVETSVNGLKKVEDVFIILTNCRNVIGWYLIFRALATYYVTMKLLQKIKYISAMSVYFV